MNKWAMTGLVTGGLLVLDQATKLAALKWLEPVHRVNIIPSFFDLTFVLNTGVSFGIMSGQPHLWRVAGLSAINLVALIAICFFIRQANSSERLFLFGLGSVASGALGNAIDRIRLGGVVDFLDFYAAGRHWPAFNVADSAIFIGVGLIMIHIWISGRRPETTADDAD